MPVLQFPLSEIDGDDAAQAAATMAETNRFFERRTKEPNLAETDLVAVSTALLTELPLHHGRRVNAWVRIEPLRVGAYIRYSRRRLPDATSSTVKVLDLASVEVDVGYARRGLFTCLLAALETFTTRHGFAALRVENVLHAGLADALRRRGYAETEADEDCFWWVPTPTP